MGAQDSPLQEPLASEVTSALVELAKLSQRAMPAAVDGRTTSTVANTMLERLLVLCAAQRGAILLVMQDEIIAEQPSLPLSLSMKGVYPRALALHNIREEDVYRLLPALPPAGTSGPAIQVVPDLSCWAMYRLPIGRFLVKPGYEPMPGGNGGSNQDRRPLQALLAVGWDSLEDDACALAVERGHKLLLLVADAAGAVIVNILQAEGIHEREFAAAEKALLEMELLKGELLGTVSHELRSPLATIKGYATTLLRHERRLSREERHQFLLAIKEASDRLEIIIERLLEMSQLDTGSITLQQSTVDVARLAQEAMTAAERGTSEHEPGRYGFKLLLEHANGTPASSVPLIMADPRRLREVLDNLLENAIKYSPEGGTITVLVRPVVVEGLAYGRRAAVAGRTGSAGNAGDRSTTHPPHTRMLEICVCDTGMGIPAEHLERIFDRFYRVDIRLTREVNGLGLGLAICKRIVELHDGVIWAESSTQGGSMLHVLLPMEGV